MADNPVDPISLALGGLGQAREALSRAPGRPWAPAWTPQAPQRVGEPSTTSFTGQEKVITLSALGGSMVKVDVRPVNPDIYIEVSKLPTRQQRKGALGVSLYDLPGVQAMAMAQGYRLEYDPVVQGMIDQWNRWCLDLEWVKNFAEFPDFHVDGLDIDFLRFQARGVAYGVKIGSFLLGDQMGCVDGSTIINVNRAGIGRKYDLATAHRRFHGLDRKNYNWDGNIPTYCRALCDGGLHQHRVLDILDKGLRSVVKISFLSGKTLRLTPDHPVLTRDSGMKEAILLHHGEIVVANGNPREDTVVSVVSDGVAHVYDVVMDDPHHNFVANGIVVHNCGKSIEALGILFTHRKALGGRIDTMLLAPTSVVGDWRAKFLKFAKIEIGVADGTKSQRVKVYERRPEFLGLSYDVFLRDIKEIANNFRPKALVADECQRFSNSKTKAASCLFDFVDVMQPQYRIPMSGSPISNRPDDLWPILRLINPVLAGSVKCFEGRYLKSKPIWKRNPETGKAEMLKIEYGSGDKKRSFTPVNLISLDPDKPEEAKLLHELRMKIAPFVVRRLKKDVLSDLPDKMFEVINIKLSKKEREVYEELQARFAEAMAGVADDGAEGAVSTFFGWFTKAQQICSSLEITGQGTKSSKIDELREFVKDYADDQKILIFSRFHEMTSIVARELKEYDPVHMHGGVPQSKRQPMVDKFQDDPGCRLFVSTLKAGGVGLTLTAGSIVVRLDRWVSPVANEQAVDRAHRIGQTKQVTVVDFVVEDSVEERILEILDKKMKMIASLISADKDDEESQERKVFRSLKKSEMLALI